MNRTRVKICGICSVDAALAAVASGCDAIGLMFYPGSPRSVSLEKAEEIANAVPAFVSIVGLFVNQEASEVEAVLKKVSLDTLQFHGSESAGFCGQFARRFIKSIPVSEESTAEELLEFAAQYPGAASLLLDRFEPVLHGGTGKSFNWSLIPAQLKTRIVLAGGLEAANIARAISEIRPYAVDVSSGVERLDASGKAIKGEKDSRRISGFMQSVREADRITYGAY